MIPADRLSRRHFLHTPYCQGMSTMDDDDEQKEHRHYVAWEELNGKTGKERKWTKYRACGGSDGQ